MKPEATIIYYTANAEDEKLENHVRETILRNNKGKYPIISVSRKPIDFGKNICVGEIPICDVSAFKQLLAGLLAAETKFCIAAESDVLYPPEYFNFIPPTDRDAYRYNNLWMFTSYISKGNQNKFWKKEFSEGAQMVGREYWIERIQVGIERGDGRHIFPTRDQFNWNSINPVITIKTGMGLRPRSGHTPESSYVIPFWGSTDYLRKKIWG